jgi:hypothetical protein
MDAMLLWASAIPQEGGISVSLHIPCDNAEQAADKLTELSRIMGLTVRIEPPVGWRLCDADYLPFTKCEWHGTPWMTTETVQLAAGPITVRTWQCPRCGFEHEEEVSEAEAV